MTFEEYFFPAKALGMNFRNYLIKELNSYDSLQLAKDKESSKRLFSANGLLVPKTFYFIKNESDWRKIKSFPEEFVIKPNSGLGGNGIILLKKNGSHFYNPAGEKYSPEDVAVHVKKILDGEFSGYIEGDAALIEERIRPSAKLNFGNLSGLPDIRIFCLNFRPAMAMIRYGTAESKGRANLTAGAYGLSLDMADGSIVHVGSKKIKTKISPADFGVPPDFCLPKWEEMKNTAVKAARLSNLGLAGVDIILDSSDRVMILEINGRPGLEIQNINHRSLLARLNEQALKRLSSTLTDKI